MLLVRQFCDLPLSSPRRGGARRAGNSVLGVRQNEGIVFVVLLPMWPRMQRAQAPAITAGAPFVGEKACCRNASARRLKLAHLDGWSQQVLVKQARVGIVTVHLLEVGLSHPRNATLEVIRCAFDPPASSSSTKAAVDQVRAYASGARNRQRIQMHSISKA